MQFTVAITVYKTPHFLPHAIQTVLAQTLGDWEILVYSDGRSRETAETVAQLEADFPIRYQEVKRKRGLYGNHLRRMALEQGRGSHVCYLGHDCLLYPTYLQTHADNIAGDPDALSVVPVAYWKGYERREAQPKGRDLMTLGEGEIDLLCVAYPRELALELDCFGAEMERIRCADFLAYDLVRRRSTPRFRPVPEQAAHF